MIGYIRDELAEGRGLDEIKKALLDEGYPKDTIDSATEYVDSEKRLSIKEKQKEGPKTDEQHILKRFSIPIAIIIATILGLAMLFFLLGVGSEEKTEMPESIDFLLFENLGIAPGVNKIAGETQIYQRDEQVQAQKAQVIIDDNSQNPNMNNLVLSRSVDGFQKKATAFNIIGKGIEKRTLVEIRFQVNNDTRLLKIVESIPKQIAKAEDIMLTGGGRIAEKDPILIFEFKDVKAGTVLKAIYVIKKELSKLETITFAAEDAEKETKQDLPKMCGDGRCVEGESYISCCQDCGCPTGFICKDNLCSAPPKDHCTFDTDCNDNDASTKDICEGKPKRCKSTPITECSTGDGYCPQDCTYDTDQDCPVPANMTLASSPESIMLNISGLQKSPVIEDIAITPENVTLGEELFIEAIVNDPNGKDDIQRVWFEVLELAATHNETSDMNDLGIDPDPEANDGIYTGKTLIKEYYLEDSYHVNVFVQDRSGNKKKMQKGFRVVDASENTTE